MGQQIDVNHEKLKWEISNLQKLLNDVEADKGINIELLGSGYTKEYMAIVNEGFNGIKNTLQFLIENTINLLENVSDGYSEIDDITAKKIQEFTSEVLGNE